MSSSRDMIQEEIDNYIDTIYAIVGFMNFYRYDDSNGQMKSEVICFQGNKLKRSSDQVEVTPDIGIVLSTNYGIIGEAKKSFPDNKDYWEADFKQLQSYDDNLTNFPTSNGTVNNYEIVLLLHQSRAVAVKDYCEEKQYTFTHPFSMVEFNRSNETKSYLFFRTVKGALQYGNVEERLHQGVQVPMAVFFSAYAGIKFYDARPPSPLLLSAIWENILIIEIIKKGIDLKDIRKNQKIEVEIMIDDIVKKLNDEFSFNTFCQNSQEYKSPQREWIVSDCQILVDKNEAEWIINGSKIKFFFKKYNNILDHFKEICTGTTTDDNQLSMQF